VTGWLRIQPGAAGLAPDAALVGQRAKALWALNEARRMAAHMGAGSVSAEMVGGVWHDSVEDPDLAFFRWFPAAFSKLMRSGSPIISGLG
jgi:hypothetical protein